MLKFCFQCGSPVNENALFCGKCGIKLREKAEINMTGSLINPNLPTVTEYDECFDKSALSDVINAANQGNVSAIYELASRYRLGVDGADKDEDKAIKLYNDVLNYQNNSVAFFNIGVILEDGSQGDHRKRDCLKYYEAACELGSGKASSKLAGFYECGQFVEQDFERAIEYYDKAIKFGDGYGYECSSKARIYKQLGKYDLAQQAYHEALTYLDEQLKKCDPDEVSWYWGEKGYSYKSLGDQKSAKECYEKALSAGVNAEAATALGIFYADGIPDVLDIDNEKALNFLKMGYVTRPDDYRAVYNIDLLALFYFENRAGKDKDYEAFKLFSESKKLGSKDSNVYLGFYYGSGIPGHVEVNTGLAFQLLDEVPEDKKGIALYYKGIIHLHTLHNEQTAKQYLEQAVQMGSEDAKKVLSSLSQKTDNTGCHAGMNRNSLNYVEGKLASPNLIAFLKETHEIDDYCFGVLANVFSYGCEHFCENKDDLMFFLAKVIPGIDLSEVAGFIADDYLSDFGRAMKKEFWDKYENRNK